MTQLYLGEAAAVVVLIIIKTWSNYKVLDVFIKLFPFLSRGDLTTRIVWSIVAMVAIFIVTIVLAMVDSSNWPGAFFWITMLTVIALNSGSVLFNPRQISNELLSL